MAACASRSWLGQAGWDKLAGTRRKQNKGTGKHKREMKQWVYSITVKTGSSNSKHYGGGPADATVQV